MPESVFPLPLETIPSGPDKMEKVTEAFSSALVLPETITNGLTALGEFVVSRIDYPMDKAYVFIFAITDDSKVYFTDKQKPYDGHHFDPDDAVPVDVLFRNQ